MSTHVHIETVTLDKEHPAPYQVYVTCAWDNAAWCRRVQGAPLWEPLWETEREER